MPNFSVKLVGVFESSCHAASLVFDKIENIKDHFVTHDEIQIALSKAEKGIRQYADLMDQFASVDVSQDPGFQRKFNAFYRVQRRQQTWYRSYYALLQSLKEAKPVFADVLDQIHSLTGRYEPSFASKLVATIDPSKPVWDVHVLANTGHKAPGYSNANKLELAKLAYVSIECWFSNFLQTSEGKICVREFDRFAPEYSHFTAIKKVDFILWQTRSR